MTEFGRGPTMDVAVDLDRRLAVAVGWGSLSIYDVTNVRKPVLKATLIGLGNTRKIILKDQLAFVAAREDGVWIIDFSDPSAPEILFQYDSIEWASGLAIDGPFLAVACRQHGVELVNVEDPRNPRHFSTLFRAHEAQSVCLANGFLYAGIWHESVVLIADIRTPQEPKILDRAELDGYGDGVAVKNNILYAATGHHSRAYRGEHSQGSVRDKAGFGSGHGLEIFDVSDPFTILDLEALPKIRRALSTEGPGHFVGPSISIELFENRYACVFWQDGGPVWFDLSGPEPVLVGELRNNLYLGVNQGIAVQDSRAIVLREGGMLSTAESKDYAHLVHGLEGEKLPAIKADLIVVQMGENDKDVSPTGFLKPYDDLIALLRAANPSSKILCTATWSPPGGSPAKDAMIREVCRKYKLPFADLKAANADKKNLASSSGLWTHPGVGWHPSDEGMQAYADAIWLALSKGDAAIPKAEEIPSSLGTAGLLLSEDFEAAASLDPWTPAAFPATRCSFLPTAISP